jgi:Predicted membrane protein (DUF2207)
MFFGVPAWALLVLAVAAGLWLLLLTVLTTATRPRPIEPGPSTLDLGGTEPPAIVNLLTNGWRMTTDALSATLLDLAARDLLDLVQTGPEPERTVCKLRQAAPPQLADYERRVYDRVAGLATGGVVPVAALARGNSAQASRWWKGFRREVIVDAQRRGLSRNRWGAGIKTLTALASFGPAAAVGLVVFYASDDGDPVWGAAGVTWALLAGYAGSRNRQRDTPAGREVAARWMGVRDHLRRNEVFDTLPPAAVAIWDRYLGYGAAAGVAGTASRVLSFGAQDERLAWSAYGGIWHKVRIRYPGNRAAEARHPALSAVVGILAMVVGWYGTRGVLAVRRELGGDFGLGLPDETARRLDSPWSQLVLLVLATAFVAIGVWGAWVVVRSVIDVGARRTFEAEVLRIRTISDDEGNVKEHQVALDDGKSEKTRAWSVPQRRMPVLHERDVVSVTVGPWLHHVFALSVVSRGTVVQVDDGRGRRGHGHGGGRRVWWASEYGGRGRAGSGDLARRGRGERGARPAGQPGPPARRRRDVRDGHADGGVRGRGWAGPGRRAGRDRAVRRRTGREPGRAAAGRGDAAGRVGDPARVGRGDRDPRTAPGRGRGRARPAPPGRPRHRPPQPRQPGDTHGMSRA